MASAKETCDIIEITPPEQPIMLEGIHGIGKSEIITEYFSKRGYRVICLFLGQMSDAGDILGLPMRKEIDGVTYTDYASPMWWPKETDEKILLFLDELNRARPEIHQVIMDLVLNRKLGTKKLPEHTRIVSAINPSNADEGIYQVEDLDPALMDRFNKILFRPTFEEWMDWCLSVKFNNKVLGFVHKNQSLLDPPSGKEYRTGHVYPSRRSWKRVSDIINANPNIPEKLLMATLFSIVGDVATSTFLKYWKENKQISVGKIFTDYKSVREEIKLASIQDLIIVNREICNWFVENEGLLEQSGTGYTDIATKICYNLENYVEDVPGEIMAEFIERLMKEKASGKTWQKKVLLCNPNIKNKILAVQQGSTIKKN
jgi:hypothetical protein